MTTLKFIIGALPSAIIPVGIREENDVSAVEVDFSAWAEEFGAGAMQLLVKRNGDTSAYPVVLTQTGTAATWTLSSTDLAKTGDLLAEYVYTVSGQVKKSCVLHFYVVPDIGTPGSAPDPYQSWLAQLTALAAQTEEAAAAILNMTVEAETLDPGSAATVTKTVDPVTGAVTLTFGIPGGEAASPYTSDPEALGTASPGSSDDFARGDHVHPLPSASDIGAATPTDLLPLYPHDTATGSIASFSDGADDIPVRDLTIAIEPVQNLNGYDSPWPAGGGVNKMPSPAATSKTNNGITISVSNGVYSISGTASALAEIVFDLPSDVSYDSTYKCAFLNDGVNSGVTVYWRYNNTNGTAMGFGGGTNRVAEYSTSATINKVRFLVSSGMAISGTLHCSPVLCLKTVTTPTSFIPYSNVCPITGWTGANVYVEDEYDAQADPTVSISWQSEAGTVYGGTLDVTTGVLTVTKAIATLSSASQLRNLAQSAAYGAFAVFDVGNLAYYDAAKVCCIGSNCKGVSYNQRTSDPTMARCFVDGANLVNLRASKDVTISDLTDLFNYFNGAQVVYELATPTTYQLTATEVKTLLGNNAIWADTGNSTVDYRADPTLYIQNAIAAAVAAL